MKLSDLTNPERIEKIINLLRIHTKGMVQPAASSIIEEYGKDPYLILTSCILSLRTRDATSLSASRKLFEYVKTPEQMVTFPLKKLEEILYPVGFYRQKSRQLKELSKQLIERFEGEVPNNEEDLLSLSGVGRKTANLVLGHAFDIPAICVDTHVHRVSNRLGLVTTKTPLETEEALKKILPKKYWIEYNTLMVMWGQNICLPIGPWVSKCALEPLCPRIGVKRQR